MSAPPDVNPKSHEAEPLDRALGNSLVKQAFDVWINPEIARRRDTGVVADDFTVYAAQIIMSVGSAPTVRLNEEITGVLKGIAAGPIEKGQAVAWSDLAEIHHIELASVDANAGHMTLLLHRGRWLVVFDFRYNAGRVAVTLGAAREFLGVARFASERGYVRAFCENLFGAAELLAKGNLLMLPDEGILKSKKHEYVAGRFNLWGKQGNADPRYVDLLNRLGRLRSSARYVAGDVTFTQEEMSAMLGVAEEMLKTLETTAPTRAAAHV